LSALQAHRLSGIEFILDQLRVAEAINGAGLVISGEGRLDEQSLRGKAPVGVAQLALKAKVPFVAVAGQISLSADQLNSLDAVDAYAVVKEARNIDMAISECSFYLRRIGYRIATRYLE
jgi:glycerate 2-kinase